MAKDDMEIVSTLRDAIVDKVGQEVFDLWLGEHVRLDVVAGVVRLASSNHFTLDRLRRKLRGDLEAACREVFGHLPALEFRLLNEAELEPSFSDEERAASKLIKEVAPDAASSSAATMKQTTLAFTASTSEPLAASSGGRLRRVEPADETPRRRFASLNSFVVGDGNRVAFTAAGGALQRIGSISPLYIYGPTGSGKTHLLEGILQGARQGGRVRRSLMLSAEQFTSHFLEALQGSGLPSFRRKVRDVDLLLLDDAQFFIGKKATIVELQHTLDALIREGRQLVIAADRSPAELPGLGAELVARMSGGLVCGMEPADYATRLGILQGMSLRKGLALPEDVRKFLAEQLPGDARQLAGSLHRLQATQLATGEKITLDMTQTALADVLRNARRIVRLPDIERAICEVFGLESKTLQSDRKSRSVSQPRMLAMWLARKYTRAALSEIGHYFGRRSHTTVISAQKKVERLLSKGGVLQIDQHDCQVEDALRRVENYLRTG